MGSVTRLSASNAVEVIPSAKRLINSLRDVGYDFVHAVADLIDNSIAANARNVDIAIHFDGIDSWVRISDDGEGMSGTAITEAMRYGAERDYAIDDLGKFGLGLKTASLSQCRRLLVASRIDPDACRIETRLWDLDRVAKTNRWEVYVLGVEDRPAYLTDPLHEHTGTVVVWENLERILDYRLAWGEHARNGLLSLTEKLDEHLGMVFHRFLTGEAKRRKKLSISINGTQVEPWDPFAREEKHTEALTPQELELRGKNGKGIVRIQPYILPPKEKFSVPRAFERASGPARWNAQQGFYVYRADRMIQSGGWCKMRTPDEHTKLARMALDFYPDLDSEFKINVAKIRIILSSELKDLLREPVERLCKRARTVYDQKERASGGSTNGTSSTTSNSRARTVTGTGPKQASVRDLLEESAASCNEQRALSKIASVLKQKRPEAARAFGW